MNWREENEFYLNNKGIVDFNYKCLKCSKMCKQSCNVLGMICKHYKKQEEKIPKKQQVIMFWKEDNPRGSMTKCSKDTGLDIRTVKEYF